MIRKLLFIREVPKQLLQNAIVKHILSRNGRPQIYFGKIVLQPNLVTKKR
jgi:hypothetical protein